MATRLHFVSIAMPERIYVWVASVASVTSVTSFTSVTCV